MIEARKTILEERIDEYGTLSIACTRHSSTVSLRGAENWMQGAGKLEVEKDMHVMEQEMNDAE